MSNERIRGFNMISARNGSLITDSTLDMRPKLKVNKPKKLSKPRSNSLNPVNKDLNPKDNTLGKYANPDILGKNHEEVPKTLDTVPSNTDNKIINGINSVNLQLQFSTDVAYTTMKRLQEGTDVFTGGTVPALQAVTDYVKYYKEKKGGYVDQTEFLKKYHPELLEYLNVSCEISDVLQGKYSYRKDGSGLAESFVAKYNEETGETDYVDTAYEKWLEENTFKDSAGNIHIRDNAEAPPIYYDKDGNTIDRKAYERMWRYYLLYQSADERRNAKDYTTEEYLKSTTAGADKKAQDSQLDVLKYSLSEVNMSQDNGQLTAEAFVNTVSEAAKFGINMLTGLSDYYYNYVVCPIKDGRFGTLLLNQLVNLGETLDLFGVGVRALIAAKHGYNVYGSNLFESGENSFLYNPGKGDEAYARLMQRNLIDAGALDIINGTIAENTGLAKIKKAGLYHEFLKFKEQYLAFKESQGGVLDALKAAYTDPEQNFLFDTDSVIADLALYCVTDPTLVLGGFAGSVSKGLSKTVARTAVSETFKELGLNGTDEISKAFVNTMGRKLYSMGDEELHARVNSFVDGLKTDEKFTELVSKKGVNLESDVLKDSLYNGIKLEAGDRYAKVINATGKVNDSLNRFDMGLLKNTVFTVPGVLGYKGYRKLREVVRNNEYERIAEEAFIDGETVVKNQKVESILGELKGEHVSIVSLDSVLSRGDYEHLTKEEYSQVSNAISNKLKSEYDKVFHELQPVLKGNATDSVDALELSIGQVLSKYGLGASVEEFKKYYHGIALSIASNPNYPETIIPNYDGLVSILEKRISKAKEVERRRTELLSNPSATFEFVEKQLNKEFSGSIKTEFEKAVSKLPTSRQSYFINRCSDSDALLSVYSIFKSKFLKFTDPQDYSVTEQKVFGDMQNYYALNNLRNYMDSIHDTDVLVSDFEDYLVSARNEFFTNSELAVVRKTSLVYKDICSTLDDVRNLARGLELNIDDDIIVQEFKVNNYAMFKMFLEDSDIRQVVESLLFPDTNTKFGAFVEHLKVHGLDNVLKEVRTSEQFKNILSGNGYDTDYLCDMVNSINNLLQSPETINQYYKTLDMLSDKSIGLSEAQVNIVLDALFGFSKRDAESITTNDLQSIMESINTNLYHFGSDHKYGLDAARTNMLNFNDKEFWGKWYNEVQDEAVQQKVSKLVADGHLNPAQDVRVQIFNMIRVDDGLIERYNYDSLIQPQVFCDLETTSLKVSEAKITSIGWYKWDNVVWSKYNEEDGSLDGLLDILLDDKSFYREQVNIDEDILRSMDESALSVYIPSDVRLVSKDDMVDYLKDTLVGKGLSEEEVLAKFLVDAKGSRLVTHSNNTTRNLWASFVKDDYDIAVLKNASTEFNGIANENSFDLIRSASGSASLSVEQMKSISEIVLDNIHYFKDKSNMYYFDLEGLISDFKRAESFIKDNPFQNSAVHDRDDFINVNYIGEAYTIKQGKRVPVRISKGVRAEKIRYRTSKPTKVKDKYVTMPGPKDVLKSGKVVLNTEEDVKNVNNNLINNTSEFIASSKFRNDFISKFNSIFYELNVSTNKLSSISDVNDVDSVVDGLNTFINSIYKISSDINEINFIEDFVSDFKVLLDDLKIKQEELDSILDFYLSDYDNLMPALNRFMEPLKKSVDLFLRKKIVGKFYNASTEGALAVSNSEPSRFVLFKDMEHKPVEHKIGIPTASVTEAYNDILELNKGVDILEFFGYSLENLLKIRYYNNLENLLDDIFTSPVHIMNKDIVFDELDLLGTKYDVWLNEMFFNKHGISTGVFEDGSKYFEILDRYGQPESIKYELNEYGYEAFIDDYPELIVVDEDIKANSKHFNYRDYFYTFSERLDNYVDNIGYESDSVKLLKDYLNKEIKISGHEDDLFSDFLEDVPMYFDEDFKDILYERASKKYGISGERLTQFATIKDILASISFHYGHIGPAEFKNNPKYEVVRNLKKVLLDYTSKKGVSTKVISDKVTYGDVRRALEDDKNYACDLDIFTPEHQYRDSEGYIHNVTHEYSLDTWYKEKFYDKKDSSIRDALSSCSKYFKTVKNGSEYKSIPFNVYAYGNDLRRRAESLYKDICTNKDISYSELNNMLNDYVDDVHYYNSTIRAMDVILTDYRSNVFNESKLILSEKREEYNSLLSAYTVTERYRISKLVKKLFDLEQKVSSVDTKELERYPEISKFVENIFDDAVTMVDKAKMKTYELINSVSDFSKKPPFISYMFAADRSSTFKDSTTYNKYLYYEALQLKNSGQTFYYDNMYRTAEFMPDAIFRTIDKDRYKAFSLPIGPRFSFVKSNYSTNTLFNKFSDFVQSGEVEDMLSQLQHGANNVKQYTDSFKYTIKDPKSVSSSEVSQIGEYGKFLADIGQTDKMATIGNLFRSSDGTSLLSSVTSGDSKITRKYFNNKMFRNTSELASATAFSKQIDSRLKYLSYHKFEHLPLDELQKFIQNFINEFSVIPEYEYLAYMEIPDDSLTCLAIAQLCFNKYDYTVGTRNLTNETAKARYNKSYSEKMIVDGFFKDNSLDFSMLSEKTYALVSSDYSKKLDNEVAEEFYDAAITKTKKYTERVGDKVKGYTSFIAKHETLSDKFVRLSRIINERFSDSKDYNLMLLHNRFRELLDGLSNKKYVLNGSVLKEYKDKQRDMFTKQITGYISKSSENLLAHVVHNHQALVLSKKGSNDYVNSLKSIIANVDEKYLYLYENKNYFYIGLRRDITMEVSNNGNYGRSIKLVDANRNYSSVIKSPEYELVGIRAEPNQMNNNIRSLRWYATDKDKLESEGIVESFINSSDFVEEYHSILKELNQYTEGNLAGSMGVCHTVARQRELMKLLPAEFVENITSFNVMSSSRLWSPVEFDRMVLGDAAEYLNIYAHEDDIIDILENTMASTVGHVQARNVYVHTLFGGDNVTTCRKLFEGFTDEEVLEAFSTVGDDFVVVDLKTNKNTSTGLSIHACQVRDLLDVATIRNSDAVMVPYEVYMDLVQQFNIDGFSNKFLQIWAKAMMYMKVGHLANPGTWIRNWIDATIKATGDIGSFRETATNQVVAIRLLREYQHLLRQIEAKNQLDYHSKSMVKAHWNEYHTKLTYEEFGFLESWMRQGLSGGESARVKSMKRKFIERNTSDYGKKYGSTRSSYETQETARQFNPLGDDVEVFTDLELSEVENLVSDLSNKFWDTHNMSEDRFFELYTTGRFESHLEKSRFDDIVRDLIEKRAARFETPKQKYDKQMNRLFRGALTPMSMVEEVVRLGEFLALNKQGYTRNQIFKKITDSQFNYDLKTVGMKRMELIFLYFTFDKCNLVYWCKQLENNPRMLRWLEEIWGTLSWDACYDYVTDEEDPYGNKSLAYVMSHGGIPIGDKGLYFKTNPSFLSALQYLYSGPDFWVSNMAAPIECITRNLLGAMGEDYRSLLGEFNFMEDTEVWEQVLESTPIAGTIYDRYISPQYVRKTWNRVFDLQNGNITYEDDFFTAFAKSMYDSKQPSIQALMAFAFPAIFGTIKLYGKDSAKSFEEFQLQLARQGKWYDSNKGKVVDISEFNTYGLNNPDIFEDFEEFNRLSMVLHSRMWDNNQNKMVDAKYFQPGGLNRDWDFKAHPEDWKVFCRLKEIKQGVKWDNNQGKFVSPDKYIPGGLNEEGLEFDERCQLMWKYRGLFWDNNQGCFVDEAHYIPGGLNGKLKFGEVGKSTGISWDTLTALKYALHGEVWDNSSRTWVKVTDNVMLDTYFEDDSFKEYDPDTFINASDDFSVRDIIERGLDFTSYAADKSDLSSAVKLLVEQSKHTNELLAGADKYEHNQKLFDSLIKNSGDLRNYLSEYYDGSYTYANSYLPRNPRGVYKKTSYTPKNMGYTDKTYGANAPYIDYYKLDAKDAKNQYIPDMYKNRDSGWLHYYSGKLYTDALNHLKYNWSIKVPISAVGEDSYLARIRMIYHRK